MAEIPITCRQCGAANPPANNFCGRCGAHLSPASAALSRPRPLPTADEARNRRNIAIIYAITAFFVLSCVVLAIVVIVWRP